ncbi:hypothetical protein SALBM311S_09748 [Streptomyces alboniger]
MPHLRSRRRLALAVPVVLSLTASLGFLPAAASAVPRRRTARPGRPTRPTWRTSSTPSSTAARSAPVKKAVAEAGGTIVTRTTRSA